jgi:hypothetical protein
MKSSLIIVALNFISVDILTREDVVIEAGPTIVRRASSLELSRYAPYCTRQQRASQAKREHTTWRGALLYRQAV